MSRSSLFLLLLIISIAACGSDREFVFNNTGSPFANPGQLETGTVSVNLELQNSRAVKAEVRSFLIRLRQGEQVKREETFSRAVQGNTQQLLIETVPVGEYELVVFYLDGRGRTLGIYRAPIVVTGGQTFAVDSPPFSNVVLDFKARRAVLVGLSPSDLAVGDFNEDGFPDMVTSNSFNSNDLSLVLNDGLGNLSDASGEFLIPAGDAPIAVETADLNRDSHLDLVVTDIDESTVSVYLGRGDGTFGAPSTFSMGNGPSPLLIADFDGDDSLDLICGSLTVPGFSTALGRGDGTFETPQDFDTDEAPLGLAVADLNGDEIPDLVCGFLDFGGVAWFEGFGDGTFGNRQDIDSGVSVSNLALADLNSDGRPDLVCLEDDSPAVLVYGGLGDGDFAPPDSYPLELVGGALQLVDFDDDGFLDVACSTYDFLGEDGLFVVLKGDGTGSFALSFQSDAGSAPGGLGVADFNGDGLLDLLCTNVTSASATLALGTANGRVLGSDVLPNSSIGAEFVELIDINADGHPDLFDSGFLFSNLRVRLGVGDGTFQSEKLIDSVSNEQIAGGDLNGDGSVDLVVRGTDGFGIYLNNGIGEFRVQPRVATGVSATDLRLGDFNQDGTLDFVFFEELGNVGVCLGNGDGTFQAPRNTSAISGSSRLAVGDLDGDLFPDLAIANRDDQSTQILIGAGDGGFSLSQKFDEQSEALDVAIADLNGDGKNDLVVSLFSLARVRTGTGTGAFMEPDDYLVGLGGQRLHVADLNGDTILDFVVLNFVQNAISVFSGRADGTLDERIDFAVKSSTADAASGDINGDGAPDLVLVSLSSLELFFAR